MKKLVLIAIALITLQVSAQEKGEKSKKMEKKERAERMNDFTPKEMAQLQTKQMTLDLDLTTAQQKEIMAINVENAKLKEEVMKMRQKRMASNEAKELTKEERFKTKMMMLDHQIAMKKKMRDILDKEQFDKWEAIAMSKRKMEKGRHQAKEMKQKE